MMAPHCASGLGLIDKFGLMRACLQRLDGFGVGLMKVGYWENDLRQTPLRHSNTLMTCSTKWTPSVPAHLVSHGRGYWPRGRRLFNYQQYQTVPLPDFLVACIGQSHSVSPCQA